MTQWRAVPGYEDTYQASDDGQVRSRRRRGATGQPLKPKTGSRGYLYVTLYDGQGGRRDRTVHSLVAETFIGPREDGMEVRHRDGVKTHNAASNLHYGTRSENAQDMVRHGGHRNARKTECPQGHPYDETNTRVRSNGWRRCRTCEGIPV